MKPVTSALKVAGEGRHDSGWDGRRRTDDIGVGVFIGPGGGLGTDPAGNIYAVDVTANRVLKFNRRGAFLAAWGWGVSDGSAAYQVCAGSCQAGLSGNGLGQFNSPAGMGIGPSGTVYVADTFNNRVQVFTAAGEFVRAFGSAGTGSGQFTFSRAVTEDRLGFLYVTDRNGHRGLKFTHQGKFLLAWGWGVADGAAAAQVCTASCLAGVAGSGVGQLAEPHGITIDPHGNVLVADKANHRVQKFSPKGVPLAAFGSFGSGKGQFDEPRDVVVEKNGSILVADTLNQRIVRLPAGSLGALDDE